MEQTNWKLFWLILAIGVGFVAVQGILAYFDNSFSARQIEAAGIRNRWSFLSHGGMWADVLIISPLVAFALSTYQLDLSSRWGIGTFVLSAAFTLAMVEFYRRMGLQMGDHCTHEGKTTLAGWIHAVYAFAAIWVMLEVFLGLTTPVVSKRDIVIFAILLTPFFYLGVKKFHHLWAMSSQDMVQVAALTAGVWVIAIFRIIHA